MSETRPPITQAQRERAERALYPQEQQGPVAEGVELDVAIEQYHECLPWADEQIRKLRWEMKRYRQGEKNG